MLQLLDRLPELLDAHARVVYPAVGLVVALIVGGTFLLRLAEPSWTPDELWQLKKDTIRALEDHHLGLTCAETAAKLARPPRHLKVVLEQLIEERFVITEEERGDTVYKLKRLQGVSHP